MLSNEENEDESIAVSRRLFNLIILGIVLVFFGIAVVASVVLGSGSFGAVIFIGPFPIVFGSGPNATLLILIGIFLAIVSVIVFALTNRRLGRFSV